MLVSPLSSHLYSESYLPCCTTQTAQGHDHETWTANTLWRSRRNKTALSALRTAIKKARGAIEGKTPEAKDLLQFAVSTIDKAVTKGVLKRETASRYISRLSSRANKAD